VVSPLLTLSPVEMTSCVSYDPEFVLCSQAQAEERGISTNRASLLLGVIGIANLVGRIILGYISDKPWINRLMVYNVCLTICGLGEFRNRLYCFFRLTKYSEWSCI
jgi:hypothetical protein